MLWFPALITLALIAMLRVGVPYADSWSFVQDYLDWQQGEYGLNRLLASHGPHPVVPGKLIYWFAMQVTKGDVSWLPLLSWTLSLGVALGCHAMIRDQFKEDTRAQWWLQMLVNCIVFTTAQGGTWLWDFVFQNFIAGACLVWSLRCLSRPGPARSGILCAGALATVATLSFGSGFTIAWLLLPLLWWRLKQEKLSFGWLVGGIVLAALLAWLSLVLLPSLSDVASQPGEASRRAESLLSRPLMTFKYLLILLGGTLGHGTSIDPEDMCMILGAAGAMLFLACVLLLWRQRRDTSLLITAYPWLACCVFAVMNVSMITLARMSRSFVTALAPRYLTFTLFFVLGLVMIIAILRRRSGGFNKCWTGPAIAVFLTLQVVNWADGVQAMRLFHSELMQTRAALVFSKVLPLWPDRMKEIAPGFAQRTAIALEEQGRLRRVTMLADTRLDNFRQSPPMGPTHAQVELVGRNADGKIVVQGFCNESSSTGERPELILITTVTPVGVERIVAFQFPLTPPDYLADSNRTKPIKRLFNGFRVVLDQAPVPADAGTRLRAYAYYHPRQRIRRIEGEFALP